jgi:hypothetical protein
MATFGGDGRQRMTTTLPAPLPLEGVVEWVQVTEATSHAGFHAGLTPGHSTYEIVASERCSFVRGGLGPSASPILFMAAPANPSRSRWLPGHRLGGSAEAERLVVRPVGGDLVGGEVFVFL